MGRDGDCPFHGPYRSHQLDLRYRDLCGHVACVWSQYDRETVALPIRLVRRRLANADADRAHDPNAAHSLHSESGCHAGYPTHGKHHGDRHLSTILAPGRACGYGPAADGILPVARGHSARLLLAHPVGKRLVHPALQSLALKDRPMLVLMPILVAMTMSRRYDISCLLMKSIWLISSKHHDLVLGGPSKNINGTKVRSVRTVAVGRPRCQGMDPSRAPRIPEEFAVTFRPEPHTVPRRITLDRHLGRSSMMASGVRTTAMPRYAWRR